MFCSVCGSESPHDSLFCRMCGDRFLVQGSQGRQKRPAARGSSSTIAPFVAAGVFVLASLGYVAYAKHQVPSSRYAVNILDQLTKRPHEMSVLNEAVTINQLGYSYVEVDVPVKASSVRLHGNFTASGGNDNTIEAYVFSEDGYLNWQKHHDASPYYTSGRVTIGTIEASLPEGAGSYYLVFNNKFSVLNPATVHVKTALTYYR